MSAHFHHGAMKDGEPVGEFVNPIRDRIAELEATLADVLGRFYESVDEIGEPANRWACGWVTATRFNEWRAVEHKPLDESAAS